MEPRRQFNCLFRNISVPILLLAVLDGSQQHFRRVVLLMGAFLMRTVAALEGDAL